MAMTMGTLGEMVMRRYTLTGGKRIGRPKVLKVRRGAGKTRPTDIEKMRQRLNKAITAARAQAASEAARRVGPKEVLGEVPNVEAWRTQVRGLVSRMRKPK